MNYKLTREVFVMAIMEVQRKSVGKAHGRNQLSAMPVTDYTILIYSQQINSI